MAEPTLKDVMKSQAIIKSSVETVHGKLDMLDRSVGNIQTRLNKQEALTVKIAGIDESQEQISKDFDNHKKKMAEIAKNNEQPENENAQLNTRIINLGNLVPTEQEK